MNDGGIAAGSLILLHAIGNKRVTAHDWHRAESLAPTTWVSIGLPLSS